MSCHQWTVLVLGGLAVLDSTFDGSVLFLALPAVSTQFKASFGSLANLGSVLALGSLGALPLGALADQSGRRRLIVAGVAGFSAANVLSGFANGLPALGLARLVAVCFEAAVVSIRTVLVVEEVPPGRRERDLGDDERAQGPGQCPGIQSHRTDHRRRRLRRQHHPVGCSGSTTDSLIAWPLRQYP